MIIIEAQGSPRTSALFGRLFGRLALGALAGVFSGLLVGCVASSAEAADLEDEKAAEESVGSEVHVREQLGDETANAVTDTDVIPPGANPEPQKPQPSPWKPGVPGTPVGAAATSGPATAPQPSPWHGFTPPPSVDSPETAEQTQQPGTTQ